MIFGKETNDWEGFFPHAGGVDHLLRTYGEFYNDGDCYAYAGHFWNGFKRFKLAFEESAKPAGRKVQGLWNNVIKIGRAYDKGKPSAAFLSWQQGWFDVVRFEMNHLQPTIVLFLSGPDYDGEIRKAFPDAEYQALSQRPVRELARVRAAGLPYDSVRTYHPNYLFRVGFPRYLEEIVASLRL